jgi:transmembrane sensor
VSSDGRIIDEAAEAVRLALGPATWWERRRIRHWIRRSPLHAREFLLASMIYESCCRVDPKGSIDVQKLLDEARHTVVPLSPDDPPRKPSNESLGRAIGVPTSLISANRGSPTWSRPFSGVKARTAVGLLVLPALPLIAPSAPLPAHAEFATGPGESRNITLESGSVINLNELTAVTIAHESTGYRVHLLHGEAFFDIRHSTIVQLWVSVGNALIEDTGTRFDVRRRFDEASVTVLEGSVKVHGRGLDAALAPSDVASAPTARTPLNRFFTVVDVGTELTIHGTRSVTGIDARQRSLADLQHETVWRFGWLTFTGETLAEVARAFNPYNRRQIVITDPSIASLQVGGRFLAGDAEDSISSLAGTMSIRVVADPAGLHADQIRVARATEASIDYLPSSIPDKK